MKHHRNSIGLGITSPIQIETEDHIVLGAGGSSLARAFLGFYDQQCGTKNTKHQTSYRTTTSH